MKIEDLEKGKIYLLQFGNIKEFGCFKYIGATGMAIFHSEDGKDTQSSFAADIAKVVRKANIEKTKYFWRGWYLE